MLSGPEVQLRLLKLLQNSIIYWYVSIRTAKITGEISERSFSTMWCIRKSEVKQHRQETPCCSNFEIWQTPIKNLYSYTKVTFYFIATLKFKD